MKTFYLAALAVLGHIALFVLGLSAFLRTRWNAKFMPSQLEGFFACFGILLLSLTCALIMFFVVRGRATPHGSSGVAALAAHQTLIAAILAPVIAYAAGLACMFLFPLTISLLDISPRVIIFVVTGIAALPYIFMTMRALRAGK